MYGLKHSDTLSLCYCIPSCFILVQARGDDSTDAQLWIAFSDVAIDCKEINRRPAVDGDSSFYADHIREYMECGISEA